ncbi:MAG: endo alpha-1,4 polygalactosaminidase, partial [Hyphomicrobiaceae bacterium]|nr:endo alpha-1,4 polygalactosaminidase [Hyphomicrobiaceae bacterium]
MTNFTKPILPLMLVVLVGAFVWTYRDPIGHWVDAGVGRRPLLSAKSWYYHLAKVDVDVIAKSDADLLVIDYAKGGGNIPLTKDEVARLKRKPDGRRRLVVSYLSIGEAEQYRFYWKPEYNTKPAVWDLGENCAWPKNNMVAFWTDAWKNILVRDRNSYLRQIIDAGFNGVYLDRIDAYWHHTDGKRDYAAEMKSLVAEIKRVGSELKPGFLVIAQNAEDLLSDKLYRNSIDGLGKEDLLFG